MLQAGAWTRGECLSWLDAVAMNVPGEAGIALRRSYLRAQGARVGSCSRLLEGIRVYHKPGLSIGDRAGISSGVCINAAAGVTIGPDTLIGPSAKIWSVNHRYGDREVPIQAQGYHYAPVTVERDVWIAANAVILPGVTVHEGAVIAAGAVVTKDVPAFSVVGGVPGRVIGRRGCEKDEGELASFPN